MTRSRYQTQMSECVMQFVLILLQYTHSLSYTHTLSHTHTHSLTPHRVEEDAEMKVEDKRIRSPPKFENPDQAFDEGDKFKEEEELEREQGEDVNEEEEERRNRAEKDEAYYDDDYGKKQYKDDFEFDMQARLQQIKAGRDQARLDRKPQGDEGGLRGRGADKREGVEEAMVQGMSEKNHRRREIVGDLEQNQQDEMQRRCVCDIYICGCPISLVFCRRMHTLRLCVSADQLSLCRLKLKELL